MKQLVAIAQRQPCLVPVPHTNIGRAAAHDWRSVWPPQPLAGNIQLKSTRGGLQFSLVIDQISASGTHRKVPHEYYGQPAIDLGFQTRTGALVATSITFADTAIFVQPCNNACISSYKRLDLQWELIDIPVVQRQAKMFQRHRRVPE